MFLDEQISCSYFCRGTPKEHSCSAWLKLAWRNRSCHLNKLLTMDNGHGLRAHVSLQLGHGIIFIFLNQNICCWYQKNAFNETVLLGTVTKIYV